jgi:hypothetical protein
VLSSVAASVKVTVLRVVGLALVRVNSETVGGRFALSLQVKAGMAVRIKISPVRLILSSWWL